MDAECIRSELQFRVSRSSGPGGQHAQKNATRVEALFDVEASAGLGESERRRVLAALGPVVRAVAQEQRSQLRNRERSAERILEAVARAAAPARPRRPTLPLQLLAYHIARLRGLNVDQPRNLAKTVTVE